MSRWMTQASDSVTTLVVPYVAFWTITADVEQKNNLLQYIII